MILKHSLHYLLARGLPGAVNFLAIALYTRLLSPDEYGRFALVIAGLGLFDVIFFQWLRLSLLRFLPAHLDNPGPLLSTLLATHTSLAALIGGLGLISAWFWPDPTWRGLIFLSVPLLWAHTWFEMNLELNRSNLKPRLYGLMSGGKAVIGLILGGALALWGAGAYGPLTGMIIGMLLAILIWNGKEWKGLTLSISRSHLSLILSYGLPLAASFALGFVVSSSDRFLIAWFLGDAATGSYAAGYDLAWGSIVLLMMIVNLAGYPLVMRSLECSGIVSTRMQLINNSRILFHVSIPSTVLLIVLAPQVGALMFGVGFREEAVPLLPWIALAACLSGLRAYHFDLAFQLGNSTTGLVWVLCGAALVNVVFNYLWIPQFGLLGAAWATLIAYLIALVLSIMLGNKIFSVPLSWRGLIEAITASSFMGLALLILPRFDGVIGLAFLVIISAFAYGTTVTLLNLKWITGKLKILVRKYGRS